MKANDHPYKVTAVDSAAITANDHPFKVLIEGGVVTPEQFENLEKKVEALEADLTFKGSVPTYADLPATADDGDTYLVEDTGVLYVYMHNEPIPLNDAKSNVVFWTSQMTYNEVKEIVNSNDKVLAMKFEGAVGVGSDWLAGILYCVSYPLEDLNPPYAPSHIYFYGWATTYKSNNRTYQTRAKLLLRELVYNSEGQFLHSSTGYVLYSDPEQNLNADTDLRLRFPSMELYRQLALPRTDTEYNALWENA